MNKQEVINVLLDEKIPADTWDDPAIMIQHLGMQVERGKAFWGKTAKGKPVIIFQTVRIAVLNQGKLLAPDLLQWRNGTMKRLSYLDWTIQLPCARNDNPLIVGSRAAKELFLLSRDYALALSSYREEVETVSEDEYPGIYIVRRLFKYNWEMPKEHYRYEGYTRRQGQRAVSYHWVSFMQA